MLRDNFFGAAIVLHHFLGRCFGSENVLKKIPQVARVMKSSNGGTEKHARTFQNGNLIFPPPNF